MILRRLSLHYPIPGMLLRNGLSLVFLDLPRNLWNSLITGKLFWINFTKFGPYDEIGDAEHKLINLHTKDNQCAFDYLVHFSG
jgi:hypothetical protein